jgi:hypothetical protein
MRYLQHAMSAGKHKAARAALAALQKVKRQLRAGDFVRCHRLLDVLPDFIAEGLLKT